ncbi:hypothetical protein F66182_6955 [Fusarium sp. NRRL 66182]|nr:hypothetical protein F66182_6955 [Fusarium sp. NRRL 66182]
MSAYHRYIHNWLDTIPDELPYIALQEFVPTSQKRCTQEVEIIPATPPNKRRRIVEAPNDNDNDETPTQPGRAGSRSLRGSDTSSLSYKTRSSNASSRSSPAKMLSALDLNPRGFQRKQLDLDDPDVPDALVELCNEMDSIATGNHIVPGYLQSEISERKTSTRSFALFHPRVFVHAESSAAESHVETRTKRFADIHHDLVLDEIMRLVGDAKDCENMGQDEAGWNNLVHTPLLQTAFYGKNPRGLQLDGFCPCTSASILPAYRIDSIHGKRVDYVFQLDPTRDDKASIVTEAARVRRETLSDTSINHTSYAPLKAYPISVSIETKRSGDSEAKAQLQMGTWQAAQWRHLYKLAADQIEILPFIPGIFVHGHKWIFVASTHQNDRTTLWKGRAFGSTETPLTTFQAIAGVRRLRVWALEVFWPWYKTCVLKIPVSPPYKEMN